MKQILTLGIALMLSVAAFAQKNVTQFLGIPIDGTKSAMIQKLKAKGFTYNASDDVLSGQFNGRSVNLHVVTNNNKVYRIMVADAVGTTEGEIKIRFNTLCSQFSKNDKYVPQNVFGEYELSDDEDISYEMSVHDKRYQAAYYQIAEVDKDTTGFTQWALGKFNAKYTEEQAQNLSEEDVQRFMIELLMDYMNEKISHKSVWFMISERFGRYYINIFYDNEKNQANGEDL